MTPSDVPKVFISYRREETAGHAGRLYDVMSTRFGDGNVFMDVDMAPGVDFVQRIKDAVGGCHVLLVIIGPRWSTITNGSIAPRLADPGDFVRLEVEEGLRRADVTVIPVLVGGARMPGPSELPMELHPLSRRNALELSDTRWRYDVDRLVAHLDRLLAGTSAVTPVPQPPPAALRDERPARSRPSGPMLALTTTAVAGAAAVVGRSIAQGARHAAEPYHNVGGAPDWPHVTTAHRVARILDPIVWSGITWAFIGAAVAVWLALRLRGPEAAVGRLVTGGLIGALAGAVGAAVFAVHPNVLTHGKETDSTHKLLLIAGIALTGAIGGALVGWVWHRRGSAGFAAGLIAGALLEGLIIATGNSNRYHQVFKAFLAAVVIVGATAALQAVLDAREERTRPDYG